MYIVLYSCWWNITSLWIYLWNIWTVCEIHPCLSICLWSIWNILDTFMNPLLIGNEDILMLLPVQLKCLKWLPKSIAGERIFFYLIVLHRDIYWGSLVQKILVKTKWPPFRRWHFQVHFLEWKPLNLKCRKSRSGQNGRHFADDIFKCISLSENFWIWNKISMKYISSGSHWQYASIGLDNGMAPIMWQALSEPILAEFADTYMRHMTSVSQLQCYHSPSESTAVLSFTQWVNFSVIIQCNEESTSQVLCTVFKSIVYRCGWVLSSFVNPLRSGGGYWSSVH